MPSFATGPATKHTTFFCSNDITLSAEQIIETYCLRWSLEVTFHEVKGRLGFEDPQNRTERAVERTAPMALVIYTLSGPQVGPQGLRGLGFGA